MMTALFALFLAAWAEDPDDLVRAALDANPDLASRRAVVDQMRAMQGVARAWPDPMLEVMAAEIPVDSWKFSREPMAGIQFRVEQMIPAPGAPGRAREVAAAETATAEAQAGEAELDVERAVVTTYWRLALVRQQEAVYARHVTAAEELEQAVLRRYEVGATGQSSVVRLDLLRGRLEQEQADLVREAAELEAMLGRALGDPGRQVATPAETEAVAPEGDVGGWVAAAANRPMLAMIDAEIAQETARAALARAEAAPDVTLFAAYRIRFPQETGEMGGSDLFSAGVEFPIPVSSAHLAGGERQAALEAVHGAEARKQAALDEIEADLIAIHAAWTRALEQARAFDERLLPDALKAREATLSDYRVGKAEFEALYMAEVDLLELEREARAAAIETRIQAALAKATIGGEP